MQTNSVITPPASPPVKKGTWPYIVLGIAVGFVLCMFLFVSIRVALVYSILLLPTIVLGIVCSELAKKKGRSQVGWFFAGAVFWPSIIIVLLLQPLGGEYTTCPMCKEVIKADAVKCKHCGSMLNEPVC